MPDFDDWEVTFPFISREENRRWNVSEQAAGDELGEGVIPLSTVRMSSCLVTKGHYARGSDGIRSALMHIGEPGCSASTSFPKGRALLGPSALSHPIHARRWSREASNVGRSD